jgi:hypothetical protein
LVQDAFAVSLYPYVENAIFLAAHEKRKYQFTGHFVTVGACINTNLI